MLETITKYGAVGALLLGLSVPAIAAQNTPYQHAPVHDVLRSLVDLALRNGIEPLYCEGVVSMSDLYLRGYKSAFDAGMTDGPILLLLKTKDKSLVDCVNKEIADKPIFAGQKFLPVNNSNAIHAFTVYADRIIVK